MSWLLLGFGLALVIEGLVLFMLPVRLDRLIAAMNEIGPEARRIAGLVAIALGVALVWLARSLGV